MMLIYLIYRPMISVLKCITEYGGAGSGKSVFITQKLLYKYLKYSKRKCLIIRKVQATQRDSCFALFKSIISQCSEGKKDNKLLIKKFNEFVKYYKINQSTIERLLKINKLDLVQIKINKSLDQLFI